MDEKQPAVFPFSGAPSQIHAEETTVDVPDSTLVRCPLVEFKMRRIEHCRSCEFFKGLGNLLPHVKPIVFGKHIMVRCIAKPVRRELFGVAE